MVVPQTVLGALGLVDGDASDAKDEPCRVGQGGDALLASRDDGASGWKSSPEMLPDEKLGRFLLAVAQRASSSAFSARILSLSSLVSLSLLRFRLFSISSLNGVKISGGTTSVQLHSRKPTSQPYGRCDRYLVRFRNSSSIMWPVDTRSTRGSSVEGKEAKLPNADLRIRISNGAR